MERVTIPDKQDLFRSPEAARSSRISAMKSRSDIHKLYTDAQEPKLMKHYVGPVRSLREHILKLSLFPNLHNNKELKEGF